MSHSDRTTGTEARHSGRERGCRGPRSRESFRQARYWRNADVQWKSRIPRDGVQEDSLHLLDLGMNRQLTYNEIIELTRNRSRYLSTDVEEEDVQALEWIYGRCTTSYIQATSDAQMQALIQKKNVAPLGTLTTDKPPNSFRGFFGNINGINMCKQHNLKLDHLRHLLKKYSVDFAGFAEANINWSFFKSSKTLGSILRQGEDTRSICGFNSHEKIRRYQPGGVGLVLFETIKPYVGSTGRDPRDLGRWAWCDIRINPDHVTRVITAYAVSSKPPKASQFQTVWHQHNRYSQHTGIHRTPNELFWDDLILSLEYWIQEGHSIILMFDAMNTY